MEGGDAAFGGLLVIWFSSSAGCAAVADVTLQVTIPRKPLSQAAFRQGRGLFRGAALGRGLSDPLGIMIG